MVSYNTNFAFYVLSDFIWNFLYRQHDTADLQSDSSPIEEISKRGFDDIDHDLDHNIDHNDHDIDHNIDHDIDHDLSMDDDKEPDPDPDYVHHTKSILVDPNAAKSSDNDDDRSNFAVQFDDTPEVIAVEPSVSNVTDTSFLWSF